MKGLSTQTLRLHTVAERSAVLIFIWLYLPYSFIWFMQKTSVPDERYNYMTMNKHSIIRPPSQLDLKESIMYHFHRNRVPTVWSMNFADRARFIWTRNKSAVWRFWSLSKAIISLGNIKDSFFEKFFYFKTDSLSWSELIRNWVWK